jgi:hypothetical protein
MVLGDDDLLGVDFGEQRADGLNFRVDLPVRLVWAR